ncbi:MAG: hypothetical protein AABX73_02550 [Nanoarchaeota archaeon]
MSLTDKLKRTVVGGILAGALSLNSGCAELISYALFDEHVDNRTQEEKHFDNAMTGAEIAGEILFAGGVFWESSRPARNATRAGRIIKSAASTAKMIDRAGRHSPNESHFSAKEPVNSPYSMNHKEKPANPLYGEILRNSEIKTAKFRAQFDIPEGGVVLFTCNDFRDKNNDGYIDVPGEFTGIRDTFRRVDEEPCIKAGIFPRNEEVTFVALIKGRKNQTCYFRLARELGLGNYSETRKIYSDEFVIGYKFPAGELGLGEYTSNLTIKRNLLADEAPLPLIIYSVEPPLREH